MRGKLETDNMGPIPKSIWDTRRRVAVRFFSFFLLIQQKLNAINHLANAAALCVRKPRNLAVSCSTLRTYDSYDLRATTHCTGQGRVRQDPRLHWHPDNPEDEASLQRPGLKFNFTEIVKCYKCVNLLIPCSNSKSRPKTTTTMY